MVFMVFWVFIVFFGVFGGGRALRGGPGRARLGQEPEKGGPREGQKEPGQARGARAGEGACLRLPKKTQKTIKTVKTLLGL